MYFYSENPVSAQALSGLQRTEVIVYVIESKDRIVEAGDGSTIVESVRPGAHWWPDPTCISDMKTPGSVVASFEPEISDE